LPSFLPRITKTDEVIVAEVAAIRSKSRLAQHWMAMANEDARNTAIIIPGSTFLETTSQLTLISTPGSYQTRDYGSNGSIGSRELVPKKISMLLTVFVPRIAEIGLIPPNDELYYRLFLKCCFTGPRFGESHEPGLMNECMWCGFRFPGSPNVMDSDTEGKSALLEQAVEITKDTFTALLTKIHTLHYVDNIEPPVTISDAAMMTDFTANLSGWKETLDTAFSNFLALQPTHDSVDEVKASNEISQVCGIARNRVHQFIKNQIHRDMLTYITKTPWTTFCDIIQLYCIVPFQRMLTKVTFSIPEEMKESLSYTHVTTDLKPILESEVLFTSRFVIHDALVAALGFTNEMTEPQHMIVEQQHVAMKERITEFITILSAVLPYKNMIRFRKVVGKELLLQYLKELILYGSLVTLMETTSQPIITILSNAVTYQLQKYKNEKMLSDPTEIKNRIESRNEKERNYIIREFDKLSPEERSIELMNKRLGLGKWAIGGTKLIYAYDKDYYDLEREKRLDAGILDFPGLGIDNDLGDSMVDELGFPQGGNEDGYDHTQQNDDVE
jgi:hypothetical protein